MIELKVLKKTLFTERVHTHTHTHSALPTSELTFLKQCQLLGITPHDKTNGGHATNYSKKKPIFNFKKSAQNGNSLYSIHLTSLLLLSLRTPRPTLSKYQALTRCVIPEMSNRNWYKGEFFGILLMVVLGPFQ
jgi:hypothetical protein